MAPPPPPHLVCWVASAVVLVVDADGPVANATVPRASTGGLLPEPHV